MEGLGEGGHGGRGGGGERKEDGGGEAGGGGVEEEEEEPKEQELDAVNGVAKVQEGTGTAVFRCVRISIRGLVRRSVGWSVGP